MRLVQVQKRVEDRLTAWTHDLERTTGEIEGQVARLEATQKERLAQFERTLAQEAEALRTEADEQRVAVMRLREEIQNAAAEAIQQRRPSSSRWRRSAGGRCTRSASDCAGVSETCASRSSARRWTPRKGSRRASPRSNAARPSGSARSLEREATRIVEAAAHEFDKAAATARDEATGGSHGSSTTRSPTRPQGML